MPSIGRSNGISDHKVDGVLGSDAIAENGYLDHLIPQWWTSEHDDLALTTRIAG